MYLIVNENTGTIEMVDDDTFIIEIKESDWTHYPELPARELLAEAREVGLEVAWVPGLIHKEVKS